VGGSLFFAGTQDECGRVAHTPLQKMWAGRPSLQKMWADRPSLRKMWAGRPRSFAENVGGSPTLLLRSIAQTSPQLLEAAHLPNDPHTNGSSAGCTAAVFIEHPLKKKAPRVPVKGEFLSLLCLRWALPCQFLPSG
jgi:hypothetical protein